MNIKVQHKFQEAETTFYSQWYMREHIDMCFTVKNSIRPMVYPKITTDHITANLNRLKAKKAAGPDKKNLRCIKQ